MAAPEELSDGKGLDLLCLLKDHSGCYMKNSCMRVKSLQSYPTHCDPMDCSPSGSSVRGIFQAGILEWVAVSSSRGSSQPKDGNCIS